MNQTQRAVWIGLTKCDSERTRRTQTAIEIWDGLAQRAGLASVYSILAGAFDLFRESLSCYQNGAYLASTLMCRCVTETAAYLAVSRRTSPPPSTIDIDFQHVRSDWSKIRERARKLKIITEADLRTLKKIRSRGNFAAHLGQLLDQRYYLEMDHTPEEQRFWSDKEEAEDTLRKTTSVLTHVVEGVLDLMKNRPSTAPSRSPEQ